MKRVHLTTRKTSQRICSHDVLECFRTTSLQICDIALTMSCCRPHPSPNFWKAFWHLLNFRASQNVKQQGQECLLLAARIFKVGAAFLLITCFLTLFDWLFSSKVKSILAVRTCNSSFAPRYSRRNFCCSLRVFVDCYHDFAGPRAFRVSSTECRQRDKRAFERYCVHRTIHLRRVLAKTWKCEFDNALWFYLHIQK